MDIIDFHSSVQEKNGETIVSKYFGFDDNFKSNNKNKNLVSCRM